MRRKFVREKTTSRFRNNHMNMEKPAFSARITDHGVIHPIYILKLPGVRLVPYSEIGDAIV